MRVMTLTREEMPRALLKWLEEGGVAEGSKAVITVEPTEDGKFTWYILDIDPQMMDRVRKVAKRYHSALKRLADS